MASQTPQPPLPPAQPAEDQVTQSADREVHVHFYDPNDTQSTKLFCKWLHGVIQTKFGHVTKQTVSAEKLSNSDLLLVICHNHSRIGTDINYSVTNLPQGIVSKHIAICVLHVRAPHALPITMPTDNLADEGFANYGMLVDFAFTTETGVYSCEMNKIGHEKLESFLKRFLSKPIIAKPPQKANRVFGYMKQLFSNKKSSEESAGKIVSDIPLQNSTSNQQTLDNYRKSVEHTSTFGEQTDVALQRLDKLAVQTYIESRLKQIVKEKFLSEPLKEIETEIKAEVKTEIERVQKQVNALNDKVQTVTETVDTLQNNVLYKDTSMDRLKTENPKISGDEETTGEDVIDTPTTHILKSTSNHKDEDRGDSKSYGTNNEQTPDKYLKLVENTSANGEQIVIALQRLDKLASKEYIESRLKQVVTKEFLSELLKEIETEIKADVKKEIERVQKHVNVLNDKVQTVTETVDTLQNNVLFKETSMDRLKAENSKISGDEETTGEAENTNISVDMKPLQDQLKDQDTKLNSQGEELEKFE